MVKLQKNFYRKLKNEPEKKTEAKLNLKKKKLKKILKDYSDKVQKRIKKLTFQIREAERREKAAVDYAKGLKNKYEQLKRNLKKLIQIILRNMMQELMQKEKKQKLH